MAEKTTKKFEAVYVKTYETRILVRYTGQLRKPTNKQIQAWIEKALSESSPPLKSMVMGVCSEPMKFDIRLSGGRLVRTNDVAVMVQTVCRVNGG